MQNILNVKEKLETQARNEFAIAAAHEREEEERLNGLIARRDEYEAHLKELVGSQLNISEIKEAEDSHPVDEVIAQSPDPDQEMKAGDTVYLTVSAGPGEDASEPVDPPDPTDPADPEPPGSDNNG